MKFSLALVIGTLSSILALSASYPLFAETALTGQWITDLNQKPLLDPQTSGATFRKGELIVVGDRSADDSTRLKLFRLNPQTGQSITEPVQITVSPALKNSCFYSYLIDKPDLEALTWDRLDDTTLITVTEDASDHSLSPECSRKFAKTNATDYPSLLLKIQVNPALTEAEIVAVRPVQFPAEAKIGNFPNDGIEGLAVDQQQNLYLALEQDSQNKPRIFKTRLGKDFWARENFVKVIDTNLTLPELDEKDHPINGIEFLPSPVQGHPGYLAAVARNDDELWLFDLTNRMPPYVHKLGFYVRTDDSGLCQPYDKLVQTALEAITYSEGVLYLVNDPWKQHYTDNAQCRTHAEKFKSMSPLLFQLPIDPRWFSMQPPKVQAALPGISGLASHDGKYYLAVQDKKVQRLGDRLLRIEVKPQQGFSLQSLSVTHWPHGQMANDLEAVCALPERPDEYLVAESGTWQGAFGRIFHLKVKEHYAQILATFDLPVENDSTPSKAGDEFEGLACTQKSDKSYLVILAERGSLEKPGFLRTGTLTLENSSLIWSQKRLLIDGPTDVPRTSYPRVMTDLYLQNSVLWASAAHDGGNNGPFHSVIYPVAFVKADEEAPLTLLAERPSTWRLDGVKVEGLARPSIATPQAEMMFATDDEHYLGVLRPLQKLPKPSSPLEAAKERKDAPKGEQQNSAK